MTPLQAEQEIYYPSEDGEPLGETGFHYHAIHQLYYQLSFYFRHQPDVYIAANMFWYYEKGNVLARVSPDLMVIPGLGRDQRPSYKSWEQLAQPAFIFEFLSENTYKNDLQEKFYLYQRLGVPEYYRVDIYDEFQSPALRGFQLQGDDYVELQPINGVLRGGFGLSYRLEGMLLRAIDTATGEPLMSGDESFDYVSQLEQQRIAALQEAEEREHEAALARQAEVINRQRAEAAEQAIEAERLQRFLAEKVAQEQSQQAEAEREKRVALQAELEALKKQLVQQNSGTQPS